MLPAECRWQTEQPGCATILAFLLLQRHVVHGLTAGASKLPDHAAAGRLQAQRR
jgi:hypothetical protein